MFYVSGVNKTHCFDVVVMQLLLTNKNLSVAKL